MAAAELVLSPSHQDDGLKLSAAAVDMVQEQGVTSCTSPPKPPTTHLDTHAPAITTTHVTLPPARPPTPLKHTTTAPNVSITSISQNQCLPQHTDTSTITHTHTHSLSPPRAHFARYIFRSHAPSAPPPPRGTHAINYNCSRDLVTRNCARQHPPLPPHHPAPPLRGGAATPATPQSPRRGAVLSANAPGK